MKSKLITRLVLFAGFILLLLAFGYWYKVTYSMDLAQNKEINNKVYPTKILIATQGSTFKNALVTNVINFYKKDTVYIKVIDVSQLQNIDPKIYNAIVILHTWEYGKPPKAVMRFITTNTGYKNQMIVMTSSGAGTNRIEGVDAIAGESILENASDISEEIIERIELVLK